jgi:hypothetical protein
VIFGTSESADDKKQDAPPKRVVFLDGKAVHLDSNQLVGKTCLGDVVRALRISDATEFLDDEWPDFVFLPKEPRPELWLDPRKLYRLHDQTVDLYVEETEDDFTPMAELPANNEESAISAGDGYLQFKEKEGKEVVSVLPKIEDLGEGMLLVTSPGAGKIGERFPVKRKE